MNFAIIGSCVGSNTISFAASKGWRISSNYVNISSLAIIDSDNNNIFIDKSKYQLTSQDLIRAVDIANKEIFSNIKKSQADYVVVDLFDFRLTRELYTVKTETGEVKVATIRLNDEDKKMFIQMIEESAGGKVVKVEAKNLDFLTDIEVESYVKRYVEILHREFTKEKVIFIKPKAVNQCIINGEIKFVPDYMQSCNLNLKIERVYSELEKIEKPILPPSNLIGDEKDWSPFMYHYCAPYYQYLIENIENFTKNHEIDVVFMKKTLNYCESEIHKLYNKIFSLQILDVIRNKLDKDIVLVAKTKQFAEILKKERNKEIFEFIEYDKDSNMNQVAEKIKSVKERSRNLIFVIPEVFNNRPQKTIIQILYENNLRYFVDYFTIKDINIYLENFEGVYTDIYNNVVESQSKISMMLVGHAVNCKIGKSSFCTKIQLKILSDLTIGDNCRLSGFVGLWWASNVSIGDNTSMGGGDIVACLLSTLRIGKDVMLSVNEVIYAGDGHPLFFKQDGEYKLANNCVNDKIEIGDHVWIGYRCIILKGAKIGSGSIIGAGSTVNKKIPNNVIAVGSPAKPIKNNVAWTRDVFSTDLAQNEFVFENFAKETVED